MSRLSAYVRHILPASARARPTRAVVISWSDLAEYVYHATRMLRALKRAEALALAQAEELEQAKVTIMVLTDELRMANNRADNCGSFLRELKRNLGIGDHPRAEVCLAQAWKRLFPDLDLKGGA